MTNQSELESQSTRNRVDKSELEQKIHALFGDEQSNFEGYFSLYDGKWVDMTGEVVEVARYITANYTPNSEVAERERVAIPEFAKPGGLIPYETIGGVNYVKLDWLTSELTQGASQLSTPHKASV